MSASSSTTFCSFCLPQKCVEMMIKRMEIYNDFFLRKMAALLLCSDIAAQGLDAYTKDLNWAVKDQNLSAMWLSGSRRPPLYMHCLSENHLAAHYPHTGDNLSSLAPPWAVSSPTPMSQWALSPYRHVGQPLNLQRSLHLLQTHWTFTQPMAANYMWAVHRIRGVKVQL